jgi:cellulose synthase/poly-beta-1,6-N-acetylglucosamine synthase-like glycosyltransferase
VGDSTKVRPVQNSVGGADSTRQAEPSLSLIIPAYNEAARIADTIRQAIAWLTGQPFATELIVVDDGSDDATADLAQRASSELGCGRVLRIAHAAASLPSRSKAPVPACQHIANVVSLPAAARNLAVPHASVTNRRDPSFLGLTRDCDPALGSAF